jgi:outer membrane protein
MKKQITLLILLVASILNAQEKPQTYSFSLQQAIDHALQNNYSAINAGRDIEASKEKKWETIAAGLPQINANVSYLNNFKIQQNQFTVNGQTNTISFGNFNSADASLQLSQLIFDGTYIVALQASKTYMKFYQNAKQKTDSEIKEMIINSYGNVLLAEESIKILEKNKASLEKTLFETNETFKNGLIEEENVEQLQITLTSINSTLNYNNRLLELAYKLLKINLGINIDAELKLTETLDNLTISNLDLSFSKNEFVVTDNINYKMAMNFQEQRQLEYKLEKSKALPSLAANLNFGYNAFNDGFGFFEANQNWFNYSNLGVSLNVPIFSSLARSYRTQQARIAFDQAKTQLTETEQKLKLQFEKAKSEYEYSIEQYTTSKNSLSLAERIENKQQIKFKEGLSSSFDFTEAQQQLYSKQQDYLQSMVDIINKKATLEKIVNKN